jgi:hypothetical protein
VKLAQAIQAGPAPDPRRRCGTCDWLALRTPEQREGFDTLAALARTPRSVATYTISDLLAEMQEDGYRLQYAALNKHLLGMTCRGTR